MRTAVSSSAIWNIKEESPGDANTFGLLLGAFGIGAVCAIFILQPLRNRFGNENTIKLCTVTVALSLVALAQSRLLFLDLFILLISGAAWMMITTTISVMVQLFVPRWVMGRAIATSTAAITLGVAFGSWGWGLIAKHEGLAMTFYYAAAALIGSLLLSRIFPIADRDASTELDERVLDDPDVQLGISGRSGPISIELLYRVDADQARDFYNLMREQQKARSRNGAYEWSLSRNLSDPEQWVERFNCPTWHDYLRLRNRRTLDDTELQKRVVALLKAPIQVNRWLDRPAGSVRLSDAVPDHGNEPLNPL
ncbi:MFS transporter [Spongiibacter pelagi]|uniref:MFS transporter n=1 Tax=Spongiibacter pelagi TaxID=2760804 RepID=UPI001CC24C4C|nr:MFS transporter [Spongiibacter pelagi]